MKKMLSFLFVITCLLGYAQQNTKIKGKVVDETNSPLPGVNVTVKGTTIGTITDVDGNYALTVADAAKSTVVFSYIGFTPIEQLIGEKTTIDVTLKSDMEVLNEVVVTALGIKKQAKALGYSVSKVGDERIMASGTPTNPLQSLYGAAAGVQVGSTASGPTGGMKINIRNAVSMSASSSTRPLFVVDGIPIHDENTSMGYSDGDNGTGINDISPDDIASIEILKGAKASVLYGSEGANGVVLITTKAGDKNAKGLGISASVTHSWDQIAFLPEIQDQYGTGRSASASAEINSKGFFTNAQGQQVFDYLASGAFGPKYNSNEKVLWWDGNERAYKSTGKTVYDDMFRTGSQTAYNVAFTSSGEHGSHRFSMTNTQLTPVLVGGAYEKTSLSLNSSFKINDKLTIKYVGNYYMTENKNAPTLSGFDAQGSTSGLGGYATDIDVSLIRKHLLTSDGYSNFSLTKNKNLLNSARGSVAGYFWSREQNENLFNRDHNIQSVTMDLEINEFLSATAVGGMDYTKTRQETKTKMTDPDKPGKQNGFSYGDVSSITKNYYAQAMLNFDVKYDDYVLTGFVGGAMRHNSYEKKGAYENINLVVPNWFSFSNMATGMRPAYNTGNAEDKLYSLLGSVQLDWKNQVFVEAQIRNDWSSILPKNNRSYYYPGISATWIVNETIKLPKVVNFAKVRASWADVGRPGPRYFSNINYKVGQVNGAITLTPPSSLPPVDENWEPNLKPEKKREYEIGFEGYFFENQRVGIDFSLYTNTIYNQIMAIAAPPEYIGVSSVSINAGEVRNNGWEILLKTKPIYTKDFKWNVNLSLAGSTTEVIKLADDIKSLALWSSNGLTAVAEVGGEYGVIYESKGTQKYINPSDANDPNNGKNIINNSGTGLRYDSNSQKKVGKILPDFTGGIFTSFEYKGFSLIANFDFSYGATFISETETYMMAAGVLDESLPFRDAASGGIAYHLDAKRQKVKGAAPAGGVTYHDGVLLDGVLQTGKPNTSVVSAEEYYSGSYFSNGFFPHDRIYKSDYIALRNIALEYTLPKFVSNYIHSNNVTVGLFVNNVAYLYKDAPNSIPESTNATSGSGASLSTTALPSQRSFGCSAKFKF